VNSCTQLSPGVLAESWAPSGQDIDSSCRVSADEIGHRFQKPTASQRTNCSASMSGIESY